VQLEVVELEKLDELLWALYVYTTESTKKQKHLKGHWSLVVSKYAKATGMSREVAGDRLSEIVC
jgi:hypothetical protein